MGKSETARVDKSELEEFRAWCRERAEKEKAARERASCQLIADKAWECWRRKEWMFTWYYVRQLLELSFQVAIDQMAKTQEPFDIAGMVRLEVKERKSAKKNTHTGRDSIPTCEGQLRVKPLKKLLGMARLELAGFRSGEVSA